MGLFSKKTDEQIIEEARKLYVAGDLSAADLKIVKLARKGNPEACYLAAKIQLEIAKTRKPELYKKSARAFLERAVAAGHKDAAVLMENVFGKSANTEDKPVKEITEPEAVKPVQEEGAAGEISAEDEQVIAEIEKAYEFYDSGKKEAALAVWKKYTYEGYALAALYYSGALLDKGEWKEALSYAEMIKSACDDEEITQKAVELIESITDYVNEPYLKGSDLYDAGKREEALEWIKKAAKIGNPYAQYMLAEMYRTGDTVRKNRGEAIKWYAKAAEQGNDEAYKMLKTLMENNSGASKTTEEKSPVADITINAEGTAGVVSEVEEVAETEAIPQVIEKTADKQEKICEDIEEPAYDDEDEIAMAEIYRAQELLDEGKNAEAKAILKKFAEEGYIAAMLSYANILAAEDKCDEAMSWVNAVKDSSDDEEILEVADEIIADIKTYLHKLFTEGMDMYKNAPFDKSEAIALIKKAAEQGDADAQFYMGEIYHEGKAVETDLDEAAKWYRKAAEQGDEVAEYKLMVLGKE